MCGKVLSVSIRCGGGKAVTVGNRIPDAEREKEDTQYAQVIFAHHAHARKAIDVLNGRSLHGAPIIVSAVS